MVERKTRTAPLTLVARKSAQSRRQVRHDRAPAPRQQAVRARHQRADARPDQPVPLRGARHLPADDDARGTRQQQEGHVRGRAQRPPGQPLPRRARQRRAETASTTASRSTPSRGGAATGRLFLQTEAINGDAARRRSPAARPTTRSSPWSCTCSSSIRKRQVILVSKDINMRIKARALGLAAEDYFNDKVLEDTDLLYTGMRELPADFWDRHGKDMESWQQDGHTFYRDQRPARARRCWSTSSSTRRRRRDAASTPSSREITRQDRACCRRSRTTRTRRTTSGASPRATASRTSRSTC